MGLSACAGSGSYIDAPRRLNSKQLPFTVTGTQNVAKMWAYVVDVSADSREREHDWSVIVPVLLSLDQMHVWHDNVAE